MVEKENQRRCCSDHLSLPYRPERAEALDYDGENQFRVLLLYFNIALPNSTPSTKKSPSGNGYHFYRDNKFILQQSIALGDCAGRIKYWEKQGYTFTFKRKGKNLEEEVDVLSLPFWSQLPARKRVRKKRR